MVPTLVIVGIFIAAFATTFWAGVPGAFAYVMLPALLLVYTVAPVEIEKLPDLTTLAAVGYGVVAGLIARGEMPRLRWTLIDTLVVTLSALSVINAVYSEVLWTGVNRSGTEFFEWLLPYFMGRITFAHPHYRLRAAQVLTGLAAFLALVALWEMRVRPLFFSRDILTPFGLTTAAYEMVLRRFSFFRAQVSFSHPIDLGNGGALLGCMILVLATTTGRRLTTPWVFAGVACAGVMTLASLSFTSFVAVAGIVALYFLARTTRLAGYALLPISAAVILGYVVLTASLLAEPLEKPDDPTQTLNSSYYIRHLIVQYTWPYVVTSGPLGHGDVVGAREMGLESVDNAYMLFAVQRGWLYVGTFLFLLVVVGLYGGRALLRVESGAARTPLAAGIGGIVGTMLGMYTVFFGFVYARLFMILLGLTVTMCQRAMEKTADPAHAAGPLPRGPRREPPVALPAPRLARTARPARS